MDAATEAVGRRASPTFDDLFERERQHMVRLALLMVGSRAEAEELVQDAFAKVLQRWKGIDNPGAYLQRCVINGCRGHLRRRHLEQRRRPAAPDPSELGADEMLDALAQLAPRRRAVVVLRYYEGLTQDEIATALAMRPGTVKSTLHRALSDLREVIER